MLTRSKRNALSSSPAPVQPVEAPRSARVTRAKRDAHPPPPPPPPPPLPPEQQPRRERQTRSKRAAQSATPSSPPILYAAAKRRRPYQLTEGQKARAQRHIAEELLERFPSGTADSRITLPTCTVYQEQPQKLERYGSTAIAIRVKVDQAKCPADELPSTFLERTLDSVFTLVLRDFPPTDTSSLIGMEVLHDGFDSSVLIGLSTRKQLSGAMVLSRINSVLRSKSSINLGDVIHFKLVAFKNVLNKDLMPTTASK